ncbi:MAG TPA: hypothetical protein HA362_01315 [Nanoarchaeota archaeon]|nr:hypothetical protein [Nanoarchaeota archaeon]
MQKRGFIVIIIAVLVSVFAMAVPAVDEDGDGYCPYSGTDCPAELDCNDNNPEVSPVADEIPGDSIDNDCNGIVDDACTDADMDGYNSTATANGADCGGAANTDCEDTDIYVNPGMVEICNDDKDNDCNGDADSDDTACSSATSDCNIEIDDPLWINCDAEEISTANEGDSVYMVLWGEECDSRADVMFKIYEYSDGEGALVDSVEAQEVFKNIPDEDGNPTDIHAWVAPWIATYITDDDETGPEYYFSAELAEEGGAELATESRKTDDSLLAIEPCDGCGIECTLDMGGFTGGGGVSVNTTTQCTPVVDCTGAPWGECDPSTNKRTRDLAQCTVTGEGEPECFEAAKSMYPSEKLCSSSADPDARSTGGPIECGDDICDEGEDAGTCPEDCGDIQEGGFPWLWIIIGVVAAGGVTTGIVIAYKKTKNKAAKPGEKKPEEKKDAMPFAQQKDLDAITGYIKAAKTRGYNDMQVTDALKKSGWKDEQIKYAMDKLKQPAQASAAQKPATQAQPAVSQPVKK